MRRVITTECTPGAVRPYVQGVDLGSTVLTSGQIPICSQTGEVAENVADQVRQSLENVKTIVGFAGLKVGDIVKTTVFVSDLNDFTTINRVYQQLFDKYKVICPTRGCVWVARLPKDAKLKIEAIAVHGDTL